jgi:hypothetical protein
MTMRKVVHLRSISQLATRWARVSGIGEVLNLGLVANG